MDFNLSLVRYSIQLMLPDVLLPLKQAPLNVNCDVTFERAHGKCNKEELKQERKRYEPDQVKMQKRPIHGPG